MTGPRQFFQILIKHKLRVLLLISFEGMSRYFLMGLHKLKNIQDGRDLELSHGLKELQNFLQKMQWG